MMSDACPDGPGLICVGDLPSSHYYSFEVGAHAIAAAAYNQDAVEIKRGSLWGAVGQPECATLLVDLGPAWEAGLPTVWHPLQFSEAMPSLPS